MVYINKIRFIALWIGTQWNSNDFLLDKGSGSEVQQKKRSFSRENSPPSELEERQPELMNNYNIIIILISSVSTAFWCWW